MKAFLLAAGMGTRLKPFTDNHPKALVKVKDKTLLEWNIKKLQKFGIQDIVVNVHHFADQIIDVVKNNEGWGSRITFSDETDALLETGGGLLFARELLQNEDNLLMMNVDILSNIDLKSLIQYHVVHHPLATLAVQKRITDRKLLFETNDNEEMVLKCWTNLKKNTVKPENAVIDNWIEFAFSGIQILSGSIFEKIRQSGKFSIIDVYLDLMATEKILGFDHTGDILLDVGKPESVKAAEKLL